MLCPPLVITLPTVGMLTETKGPAVRDGHSLKTNRGVVVVPLNDPVFRFLCTVWF